MDKQLGICDICAEPVYEKGDPIKGGYIKVCGTYAHAICAENYGKDDSDHPELSNADGRD